MNYNLTYKRCNETSILIEWPAKIDEHILQDIINFKYDIEKYFFKQKVEIINTYNSLLIDYDLTIENINDEVSTLKSIYNTTNGNSNLDVELWEIPVCYDDDFGIDLNYLSQELKLSKTEIIKRHSQQIYTVYFIGFLPGFLYLGGLDKSLYIQRKSTPNLNIKKGAVAIGGKQTGIYPQDSPGGWHIIGNSPVNFFDIDSNKLCFAKSGDKIQLNPISKLEYDSILHKVNTSSYTLTPKAVS